MVYFTLFILCTSLLNYCYCFQVPTKFSSFGDNAIVLCVLAAFGTISLIGACALCFRRKKTFEKLENEAGSPENIKKNEFPIFRALATEINESSAIVPGERNNLSRDNLLNSSDHLVEDESSLRKHDGVDSSDVVLLEKTPNSSQREKSQQVLRDTIIFETEKKHQSPSSKTPLLYAKNVQCYQDPQPINEQIQQKSVTAVFLSSNDELNHFYTVNEKSNNADELDTAKVNEVDEFNPQKNISTEESKSCTISSNPFFNSTVEDGTLKEVYKDDASEIESSINDNSEKYQILEEETDCDEARNIDSTEDLPLRLERQNSKGSNCSTGEKSIEEALRALDIAIGFEDDEDELEAVVVQNSSSNKAQVNLDEIKEEATFLVESIVNDCEKILKQKQDENEEQDDGSPDTCFDEFLSLRNQDISTPCTNINKAIPLSNMQDIAKALFAEGLDISTDEINNETFPVPTQKNDNNNQTFEVINDKTFDAVQQPEIPIIKIDKDKDEVSSEDLTTVTPVNTPIELSYSSETWNKLSYSKDAPVSSNAEAQQNLTFNANECGGEITFNHDGWYLHSQSKSDTFDICGGEDEYDENEEGNMEDMSSTFDQLRRQLTEMLPHAQGMSAHNDFLDDDLNKDSNSPSDNYGIKYGELDEATNAGAFDLIGTILNAEPVTELNINYNNYNNKRPLSPIMEESECEETCKTFVLNNETRLLDSTSTGIMESASADAVMGQVPKALMASNDTLFNFEDTLSDHTDALMSPRITAGSSTSSTLSRHESHDRISNERTPTNEELPKIPMASDANNTSIKCQDAIDILKNNIRQHPLNLDLNISSENETASSSKYELAKMALEEGSWPLELPEAQQIINDLSSPEQNRTADSLSFEQDITYTIDDQKTCVSLVLKNDEERISEISEPLFASESLEMMLADDDDKANSLAIDDALSLDMDDNFNYEMNDENGNQSVLVETKENEMYLKEVGNYENDSINPVHSSNFEIDSLEPEVKILNDDMEADSIPASQISKSVYSNDSINDNTVQNSDNSESDNSAAANVKRHDSSEDSEGSDRNKVSKILLQTKQ